MYYSLNSIGINYIRENTDSFNTISEVVNSGMSYSVPILVSTTEELDIWFGKSIPNRNYYQSLIDSGVSLYLYKPVSNSIQQDSSFVDYSNYIPVSKSYEKFIADGGVPKEGYLYISEDKYKTTYILYQGDLVSIDDLPQNINNFSVSLNNRDTVSITKEGSKISYFYPEYNELDGLGVYSVGKSFKLDSSEDVDSNYVDIYKERMSSVFTVKNKNISNLSEGYLVFPEYDGETLINTLYYCGDIPDVSVIPTKNYKKTEKVSSFEELIEKAFASKSYMTVIRSSVDSYDIYSTRLLKNNYFYSFSDFELSCDTKKTFLMITNSIDRSEIGINMWSKTIGTDSDIYDDDKYISVTIEEGTLSRYARFIIKRYDYEEVFEGPLVPEIGEEKIDSIINVNSKLIHCDIFCDETNIRYGTYVLLGATDDSSEFTPDMYLASTYKLFNDNNDSIYPDFLFVRNLDNYGRDLDNDKSYYNIYDTLLDITKDYNTQILVQNEASVYSIEEVISFPESPEEFIIYKKDDEKTGASTYKMLDDNGKFVEVIDRKILLPAEFGGDYVFNKKEDENRIIYFISGITAYDETYPGWYLFLEGLYSDIYSNTSRNLISGRISATPYDDVFIEYILEEFKCNYLSYNNHLYYYKKYFNGSDLNTSIIKRFAISKITRELEKNKWSLVSLRKAAEIRSKVESVIEKVSNYFSIYESISIDEFNLDLTQNRLDLTLLIYIKDLVNDGIRLDITINYNKTN